VASELRQRGVASLCPTVLLGEGEASPEFLVQRVSAELEGAGPVVLVAYSAATKLVPQLAMRLGPRCRGTLFVDGDLPAESGPGRLAPITLLELVAPLADADGVLPPWSQWFGPGSVSGLFADPDQFAAFEAELPRVPLEYLEAEINLPPRWRSAPAGYIRLSEAYDDAVADAARRGIASVSLDADHVAVVTRPVDVASAILDLASQLGLDLAPVAA
jgi:hypothetical protein